MRAHHFIMPQPVVSPSAGGKWTVVEPYKFNGFTIPGSDWGHLVTPNLQPVVVPLNVSWFSAGVSSAVATKLCIDEIDRIIYTHIDDQHEDTMRFVKDCEAWFGKPVEILQSPYKNVENAVLSAGGRGYINGPYGAACTARLKKRVRQEWEMEQGGIPLVYFWGMDAGERNRAERLPLSMPKQSHRFPLIEQGISKEQAHQMLAAAGIKRPAIYDMGFHNGNCLGCVKGGRGYWGLVREKFPEVFAARAALERKVGASCIKGVYLDELPAGAGRRGPPICDDCGIMCEIYAEAVHGHNNPTGYSSG